MGQWNPIQPHMVIHHDEFYLLSKSGHDIFKNNEGAMLKKNP